MNRQVSQPTTNLIDREKLRFIGAVTISLIIVWSIYSAFIPGWGYDNGQWHYTLLQYINVEPTAILYAIGFYTLAIITLFAVSAKYIEVASWGPAAILYISSCLPIIVDAGAGDFTVLSNTIVLILFMALTSLFNGTVGIIIGTLITLISFALAFPLEHTDELITIWLLTSALGFLFYLFNRFAVVSRQEGLTSSSLERLRLAELSRSIASKGTQYRDLDEFFTDILNEILATFEEYYHAQVFLIDELGIKAQLVASTGEVGKQLTSIQHNLPVGSRSVIGQVTATGKPIVARTGQTDSVHRPNKYLPETRLEAAFPLAIGGEIIGVLDLQSQRSRALSEDDLASFKSLAESIALAIDNIRQFQRAETQIQENEALAQRTQAALREVQMLNRRLTQQVWSDYLLDNADIKDINVDLDTQQVTPDSTWTSTLAEAIESNKLVHDERIVAIPLQVRGQVIGAMEFEIDEADQIPDDALELLNDVSERFGLAIENVRLVDETQRSAQQAALINQINQTLQASQGVDTALSSVATSLYETLKVERIAIRLGKPNGTQPEEGTS